MADDVSYFRVPPMIKVGECIAVQVRGTDSKPERGQITKLEKVSRSDEMQLVITYVDHPDCRHRAEDDE